MSEYLDVTTNMLLYESCNNIVGSGEFSEVEAQNYCQEKCTLISKVYRMVPFSV